MLEYKRADTVLTFQQQRELIVLLDPASQPKAIHQEDRHGLVLIDHQEADL